MTTTVLLAGLSRQSSTAVEHVAGQVLSGARFLRVGDPGSRWSADDMAAAAARSTACIMDLLGLGWSRWSPERERELESLLGPRPAVLLVPAADGGGWLHVARDTPPRVLLQPPMAVTALREALQAATARRTAPLVREAGGRHAAQLSQAAGAGAPAASRAAAPESVVTVGAPGPVPNPFAAIVRDAPATRRAVAAAPSAPSALQPAERRGAPSALACSVRGLSLDDRGLQALRIACPGLASQGFLMLVLDSAHADTPTEMRVASRSGAVFNPRDGWVASNIPTVLRDGLLRHELMLQTVTTRRVAFEDALQLAEPFFGRRRDGLRPLAGFVWSLADAAFARAAPVLERDLVFQLHRFPDFARLRGAPDGFQRLAVVCLTGPQSVRALEREFPMLEPGLVPRFALVALLSGQATLREEPLPPARRESDAPPPPPTPARRGLLRALLARLF